MRESKKVLKQVKEVAKNHHKSARPNGRLSFNVKKHVKNSLTETSLANFSKRKLKANLNSDRSKFSERHSHKGVDIDFEKNSIFSTMHYKKPKKMEMFSNVRKKGSRLKQTSTSREKKNRFGFGTKKLNKKTPFHPRSKTPKKNISIRKQIKNIDKKIGTKSNNTTFFRKKLKGTQSTVQTKNFIREISNDRTNLRASFVRQFSKPTSLEKPFRPRLSSYDKQSKLF